MTLRAANLVLAAAGAAAVAASILIGPAAIDPKAVFAALFSPGDDKAALIVREIRLPRALAAWLAGAALGASGATLQGLLRNPLADPGVLGISGCSALAAVVAIFFGVSALTPVATPVAAIAGAAAAVVLLFALGAERISATRLVLVGVGLSSFAGALIALAMNLAPNPFALSDLVNWLFGTVANRSFDDLALAAPFLAGGLALALTAAPGLKALSLGEETAASIGADLAATRFLAVAGAALMTGAAVSLAGAVGFVGVVAPHLARPFARHDPAALVIPAALLGGAMLALADLIIRLLPFHQELRLGVAAALIGAPAFVWIAARTQRLAR